MLIISAATIFLSLSIIFLLHRFSRSEKNRELLRFTEESCAKIQAFGIENELLDLPYHISYGIFDKETGTEAFNEQLSKERAEAVYNYLLDLGVDKDRLKIDYKGDKEQPFSGKAYMNRVAVIKK